MDRTLLSAILALLLGLSQALSPMILPNAEDVQSEDSAALDITSRILEANKGISHMLMEGDVAVSKTRNAMKCWGNSNHCKWRKSSSGLVEVPYTISDYFYDYEKTKIENAMESFNTKSCVRFVPWTGQTDYISVESKEGCWSYLGKYGGKQMVSLNVYGCLYHGIIQHELLHALGFYHEHTRSDRDQYVKINWENIQSANAYNFKKKDTNNLNTPYDYSSVMHYGRTAFTTEYGKDTITPVPDPSVRIGQRQEMSDTDIERINQLYECNVQ